MAKQKHAISPLRGEDFPEWYQQVLKAGDLAENSPVRGSMVIKPWGFAIWEHLQKELDDSIKERGIENCYFPLFIPLSFMEREAKHVEGFAKECAVVTHHRLEEKDGRLVPTGELEEPLIVRPTSEMIIGECFSRWVESYRDLPLKINQWANVVRWEMRPRIFLRTTEFLWQEGHTVHATEEEAMEETMESLYMYEKVGREMLAMPWIMGEKSPGERFPGAEKTFTIEAMMHDRKALQGGTSHYLGQNFAKAQEITYSTPEGDLEHAYTTSWGVTTRLIGAMIMIHGDDDGLRIPPRVAPKQVVIIPVIPNEEAEEAVLAYADKIAQSLKEKNHHGQPIRAHVDTRDMRGGEKGWDWVKKGVPVRIEVGPRDIESNGAMVMRRDRTPKEKEKMAIEEIPEKITAILDEIHDTYYTQAKAYQDEHTYDNIKTLEEMKAFFTPKNPNKPEIHGGFVRAKWCEDPETEEMTKEMKVTIRCIPLEQSGTEGKCILTGKPATTDVIFAKSY